MPPLGSVATAFDLPFLAYAARQVARRTLPGGAQREFLGPTRRRYSLAALVRKMESAGFDAIESGPEWHSATAGRSTVTARKASSLPGVRGAAWPDASAHRARYAQEYAGCVAAREAWLSRFPAFRGIASHALEPAAWRDARVLVLSPHPDDELIGCGGTLRRLGAAGAQLTILQATDGSRLESLRDLPEAQRKTVRLKEAARVAAALGATLILWGEADSRLRPSAVTFSKLAAVLEALRPTHVFTPFLADPHADHRALSRILGGALGLVAETPQVLQYEVWSLLPANLHCDVTGEIEHLERLLWLYERAMRVDNFVHFCRSRDLARALELTGGFGYVEAFLSTSSETYRKLTAASCV